MSAKIKLMIGIICFLVLMIISLLAYRFLNSSYRPGTDPASDAAQNAEDKIEAIDFTVYDAAGNPVTLFSKFDKPVILNFWASWCPPCKAEMPDFQALYEEKKDEINFMMINQTDGQQETRQTAQEFLTETGYTFPVYFDTGLDAGYLYGVSALPATLFIDKVGYVIYGRLGQISGEELRAYADLLTGE